MEFVRFITKKIKNINIIIKKLLLKIIKFFSLIRISKKIKEITITTKFINNDEVTILNGKKIKRKYIIL